ncbi:MAG: hypothetical protein ACFB51_06315, partial [Anaerolineae bacterium]
MTQDGLITEQDACVLIGGPVTAIRPVQFAMPLVDSALLGFQTDRAEGLPIAPGNNPQFSRLFFSTGATPGGNPTQIITAAPAGITSLYLFFDYNGMPAGIPYELRVTRDGIEMPQFGLGPLAWGGGIDGMWYIGTEGIAWPNGAYQFDLLLNGQIVQSARISIGVDPDQAVFSSLTFGVPDDNLVLDPVGTLLPAQVARVDGRFTFSGIPDGQVWTEIWYLDGAEVSNITRNWDNGPTGQIDVNAIAFEGLPMGRWRLELFINDRLAATGDTILAGTQNPSTRQVDAFNTVRIANNISREGTPAGQVGTVMPVDTRGLYLFFNWNLIPVGTEWTYRWFLDGRVIASSTQRWDGGGTGENFWVS